MRLAGIFSAVRAARDAFVGAGPVTAELLPAVVKAEVGPSLQGLLQTSSTNSFMGLIRESFTGAWQRNVVISREVVLANWAVFACLTRIASDIGKMRVKLVSRPKGGGIWTEAASPSFSPVLAKPNRFQTMQKFIEQWIVSKLAHGNAYILLERDDRQVVIAMYVLNPQRVRPLIAPDGAVYYSVSPDELAGLTESMLAIPASEIIHDRMVCLFHPLCGVSPLFASGLAAMQGLNIQRNSAEFFQNMSQPGGILTAPDQISDDTAARLKKHWEENYSGSSVGKVAVLGDGLKYEKMAVNAVDADLVKQLQLTAEMVCSTFHVPAFKVGMAPLPAGQKVSELNQIYWGDCLQELIKSIEDLLDLALGLTTPKGDVILGTYFELEDLLAMDAISQTQVLVDKVKGALMKPNEAREKLNLPPAKGGNAVYMQQQNYSLEALAKRDATADPFGKNQAASLVPPDEQVNPPAPAATPAPAPQPAPAPKSMEDLDLEADAVTKAIVAQVIAGLLEAANVD